MSRQTIVGTLLGMSSLLLFYDTVNNGLCNIILAVIPIVGWGWFFCLREQQEESDLLNVLLAFSAGYVVAPVFVLVGEILNPLWASVSGGSTLAYFVLRAGVVEELSKLSAVLLVVRFVSADAIRRPVDSLFLAAAAALGFAFYENLFHNIYLLQQSAGKGLLFFGMGGLVRVPMHVLYASLWAPALLARSHKELLLPLGMAMFLHGLWDTIAQNNSALAYLGLALFFAALWYSFFRTKKAVEGIEMGNAGSD